MDIDIGTDTATTITGYVSGFIGDFATYITLILGVLLAVYIMHVLVDLLRGNKRETEVDI